ncbi:DUF4124 domain-containing protein [Luteimonas marina]|uniref:DUF4124 domain-containing protein n=1 Tax=Luteimonas marina TaxID=488485 RepID=A0A5C5U6J3_9GAMM|nr:DUF4124 domain-containing protein [Luteimonas marina]TWT21215.1 DUF4124 domain-containing protein [Luteimonas marina]
MRLAWAIVAGAVGAGVLAWWLTRDDAPSPQAQAAGTAATTPVRSGATAAGPALYRWRDADGVVQITDVPPKGREYTVVDVGSLERRNVITPNPEVTEAR